jgi:uncharacterized glyoxalase superfamily protein PhnB
MKATSILVADRVEPSRQFFCDLLGFHVVVEVPHGEATGFSLLHNGDAEIMLQSAASVADDLTPLGGETFRSIVYIDVPDVTAFEAQNPGLDVVVPLRKTFYGATELFVREPGGNIVGLSTPDSAR